tara:strand:- start:1210 stop:1440 length:231 start_codon:yes stop_codon:yes gene_type:complete
VKLIISKLKEIIREEIRNLNEIGQSISTKQDLALRKMSSKELTNKRRVQKLAKKFKVEYNTLKNHIEREFGYLKVR